jgi:hypothetical protein
MNKKLVSNSYNLIPAIIALLWSLFTILLFFTVIPTMNKTNKLEGAGMFIIGMLMFSSFVFFFVLLWIIISNIINKVKFYTDIQYSLIILITWVMAMILS